MNHFDDADHNGFQARVTAHILALGGRVEAQPYHRTWSDPQLVAGLTDATSILERGTADSVAVFRGTRCSLRYECKTSPAASGRDTFSVTALPLIGHIRASQAGAECIYCCCRLADGRDFGFHVEPGLLLFDVLFFPFQCTWTAAQRAHLMGEARLLCPGTEHVRMPKPSNGSQHPFFRIPASIIVTLPDWHALVAGYAR